MQSFQTVWRLRAMTSKKTYMLFFISFILLSIGLSCAVHADGKPSKPSHAKNKNMQKKSQHIDQQRKQGILLDKLMKQKQTILKDKNTKKSSSTTAKPNSKKYSHQELEKHNNGIKRLESKNGETTDRIRKLVNKSLDEAEKSDHRVEVVARPGGCPEGNPCPRKKSSKLIVDRNNLEIKKPRSVIWREEVLLKSLDEDDK